MNIYGDRGNLAALVYRARLRRIHMAVVPLSLGQSVDANVVDILFMGGGQDQQQLKIADDLLHCKASGIDKAVAQGVVMLGICGGYQLMGRYYQPHEGPKLRGLGLVDAYTEAGSTRLIGNVIVRRHDGSTLVGFENHSGKTYLGAGVAPLGWVIQGGGNNNEDKTEGVCQGNLIGTYLHGSLLPKNPTLTDMILSKALKRRYGESAELAVVSDLGFEQRAHRKALSLAY